MLMLSFRIHLHVLNKIIKNPEAFKCYFPSPRPPKKNCIYARTGEPALPQNETKKMGLPELNHVPSPCSVPKEQQNPN